jgi:ribosomal protein S6
MRNYELFLILKPKKDEATAQKSIREVEAVLNKYGAKLVKNHGGSNFRLGHPIDKRMDSFQATLEIEVKPEDVAELRRQLILVDEILRFNIFALNAA